MKKKEPKIIFNVHNDSELEALAKAYVQAANSRRMTATQAKEIIAQVWREDILDPRKQEKLKKMPLKENSQQKAFREKAKKFVEHYPEVNYLSTAVDKPFYKDYVLELICAIYKAFIEEDYITASSLKRYIKDYFKQVSDVSFYPRECYVSNFLTHLLDYTNKLTFKTTGNFSKIGVLMYVDTSFIPDISPDYPSTKLYSGISGLFEPYQKLDEYACRKNKTVVNVSNLIWVIETFF